MGPKLRHDRLFLPGSATLRDDALAPLTQAIQRVKATLLESGAAPARRMRFDDPPARAKKRDKNTKKVLIRSYTQGARNEKEKVLEENPKLSTIRSKVLFMLFTKEGLAAEPDAP